MIMCCRVCQPWSLCPAVSVLSLCCTRIVHPGLNDLVDGEAVGGGELPEAAVHFLGERLGHVVVVFGQIRELIIHTAPIQSQRQLGHALRAAQT